MSLIDREFDVTVVAVCAYGLSVQFGEGEKGTIDNGQDPHWRGGTRGDMVGKVLRAVVVEDQTYPIRLSALEKDIELARRARERGIHPLTAQDAFRVRREHGTM